MVEEYGGISGPYRGAIDKLLENVAKLAPPDENPQVARAIVEVVGKPYGSRPLHIHVNTEFDGGTCR